MKIGYDAKRAVSNMTGLGNYSRLVVESIADAYPDSELYLYTPLKKSNARLKHIESMHNVQFRLPPQSGFKGSLWRTFGITNCLRPDKIDIFHGLSNELPLNIASAYIPTILTMHDLIYRRLPQEYNPVDRWLYDYKYGTSCHNATRIIAISERTKKDIIEYYGIDERKIDVIYQGCDNSFVRRIGRDERESVRSRLDLPSRYILQVGTIEARKNLELTVKALSSIPSDIKLLAVGRDRKGYRKRVETIAKETGVFDRVVFRDNITFADLPAVYQMAEVVVYPSRYEGFGIPVLEGLTSRRPVIAATGSCLEEAGGDAAIYINPDKAADLAQAVNGIIGGSISVSEMIGRGDVQAARFKNLDIASAMMDVYRKTMRQFTSEANK